MNIFGYLVRLDRIILIHRGRPRDKVNRRCLDVLNEYGTSPIKLIRMIVINRGQMISFRPFR